MQEHIDTTLIPFSKIESTKEHHTNIIKINIRHKPVSATSDTYELKINIFENSQSEELLALLNKFKKAINKTGTAAISRCINHQRTKEDFLLKQSTP